MQLPDGTIIPSFLGAMAGEPDDTAGNLGLKIGEIKEIIYPKSDKSVSKKFIEYRVIVQAKDNMGRPYATEYGNCFGGSLFGGVADKLRFTYRKQSKASKSGLGEGSKVIILCINGLTSNALILGGLRDGGKDTEEDKEDDGHNYFWEFNGVRQTVNKDGELTILFRGATNADGTLADGVDKNKSGATLTFTKDGGVELFDGGGGQESIKLDLGNHLVSINSDDNDGNVHINSPAGGLWKSKKTITLDADKVKVGSLDASEALFLGTTTRSDWKTLNQSVSSALSSASSAIQIAGQAINTAAQAILPLTALPAKPGLIAAAQALNQAGQGISQAQQAFDQFEQSASNHLSEHHTTEK